MRIRWSESLVSACFLPAGLALGLSALTLPHHPYTGVVMRSGEVVSVEPGGPAARAGLHPGDRLRLPGRDIPPGLTASPLATAHPGRPLLLERIGGGGIDPVWIVPENLPPSEWRAVVALLTVATGFVLLASLVWSERRDRLTRAFVLLCLAFAGLLAPFPAWSATGPAFAWELVYSMVTLLVPALCIHFFALFPEPPRAGTRLAAAVRAAYLVSFALLAGMLLPLAVRDPAGPIARVAPFVEAMAAIWFTLGLLGALALFVRAYARAGGADARRRLRVAVLGVAFGAGPLACISLVRNLSPATEVPFERAAVMLTLLVPTSFAWAIAVHRLFDIGVALRIAAAAAVAAFGAAVAGFAPGWIATVVSPAAGESAASAMLVTMVAGAVLAGPVSQRLRALLALGGITRATPLSAWAAHAAPAPLGASGPLLDEACRALAHNLRIDRCAAYDLDGAEPRLAARVGADFVPPPPGPAVLALPSGNGAAVGVDEVGDAAERSTLERAGVRWIVRVGSRPVRAVLMLGRRLSGAWLGRLEALDVARFADHLELALENAALRRQALTRGAMDRELAIAGELQAHRLPRRAPAYPTLDCAAAALSCEPVGGDYYDFVETSPRDFTLAVGDAAGKGVPAALVLAGVQTRMRTEAARGALPGEMLGVLNRELVAFDQPDRFMGLLCARVDVRGGRLWLANAGITPPLIRRRGGGFEELTESGVLLGVSPGAIYRDVAVELDAGDVVVLHTDGLTEARRGDELFGTARVRAVLDACSGRRATDVLEALIRAVRDFTDRPLDDLTIVVLRQLAAPVRPTSPSHFALKFRRETAESME